MDVDGQGSSMDANSTLPSSTTAAFDPSLITDPSLLPDEPSVSIGERLSSLKHMLQSVGEHLIRAPPPNSPLPHSLPSCTHSPNNFYPIDVAVSQTL